MRIYIGYGGWVAVDGLDLPGPLYVRVREEGDRLRVSEFYLDASTSHTAIDGNDLRNIPFQQLETFINANAEHVKPVMGLPAPDLSTLASYYQTGFGNTERQIAEGNWVVASFAAQSIPADRDSDTDPDSGVRIKRVPRQHPPGDGWKSLRSEERDYRLPCGPKDGVTDEFLRKVARAYNAAILRGERPNVAIAEQTGYQIKSAQRWVYTARQRGIMPRGRKGRAG
ncbi:hypothetical protein C1I98_04385 [Spongiactinospora gelatinilytica]|uniref:Uncharacterized protein n=1 Tax=Spongiactinospora gelatinilytica TaxID=2666298 RepID=A0A2W2HRT0_9ACTN|nr:hypothetical protein [Spongiactinospora gelatinilytica]PZG54325.1 hypothetical protein C1I98_04385 [Spongiactinospora gelatinilytica]